MVITTRFNPGEKAYVKDEDANEWTEVKIKAVHFSVYEENLTPKTLTSGAFNTGAFNKWYECEFCNKKNPLGFRGASPVFAEKELHTEEQMLVLSRSSHDTDENIDPVVLQEDEKKEGCLITYC